MPIWLQTAPPAPLPSGYGASLLQTLLALAAVCVLAWVVLKWSAGRGFGIGARGGRLRVLERVPLDPRRSVYLVQVDGRCLVLGAGESGPPALLTELRTELRTEPRTELREGASADKKTFSEIMNAEDDLS